MRALRAVGVLLATLALAAGCSRADAPAETPAQTSASAGSPTSTATPFDPGTTTGVGGLDVHYLGADGTIKTLSVEDFPR